MDKEMLINGVVSDMDSHLNADQLKQLKTVILLRLRDFTITKQRNELVIYDETSDIAAYKQYFVSKKIQGLSEGTLKQYKYAIDRFMRWSQKPYCEVTTNDIRLYIADRSLNDKLSNNSLSRERGAICRFFKWLKEEEFIAKDPGAKVEMIRIEKKLKEPFSELEVEELRACCNDLKESAVIELLMSTWCRVSELCRLHFDNLDPINNVVTVIAKGNKEKKAYLNPKAQVALTAYWYHEDISEGYLLQGRSKGSPMTTSGIQKMLKRIGNRAAIENVHPHRFRRTAATLALRKEMSLEKIMYLLGHSSMDTTLLYARVSDDELALAHKKFVT